MELFQKVGNNIYGVNGTSFGTSLSHCQVVDYLYQLGFKDNEQIKLNIEQYTGVFTLQNQSLIRYFPSYLSTFNQISSPTFRGSIGFYANGNQIISHVGAGQFQLSTNNGLTWSNLASANVAGIAGVISSSLKNNFHFNLIVGSSNLNSFAYYNNGSWVIGNMPGNTFWNAVYRSYIGPIQTVAVGYGLGAYLGAGNSWYTTPISNNGDWRALAAAWDNWIALDYGGRITKSTVPWASWSTPEQLFTAGAWNVDLDVIRGSQGYRFVAVGYSLSNATAELYISNLLPNNSFYDINNISWSKINIPNGRWFKINNKSSVSNRPTDIIYITEDPDDNSSQNRALVSWNLGENWQVINLPTNNGSKGSFMCLDKSDLFAPTYMRWLVTNGQDFAGKPVPNLYSGVALIQ